MASRSNGTGRGNTPATVIVQAAQVGKGTLVQARSLVDDLADWARYYPVVDILINGDREAGLSGLRELLQRAGQELDTVILLAQGRGE